jgi:hypothetical protein
MCAPGRTRKHGQDCHPIVNAQLAIDGYARVHSNRWN